MRSSSTRINDLTVPKRQRLNTGETHPLSGTGVVPGWPSHIARISDRRTPEPSPSTRRAVKRALATVLCRGRDAVVRTATHDGRPTPVLGFCGGPKAVQLQGLVEP